MKRRGIKARIVEAMRVNRECDAEWLFRFAYGGRHQWPRRDTLKAHIWQLRRLGYPIVGMGRGRHPSRYEWSDGC